MTPGGSEHGVISMELGVLLAQHVRARRLGVVFCAETGFLISRDPDTVLDVIARTTGSVPRVLLRSLRTEDVPAGKSPTSEGTESAGRTDRYELHGEIGRGGCSGGVLAAAGRGGAPDPRCVALAGAA